MSKVGSTNIIGDKVKITVTNASKTELQAFIDNNIPLSVHSSIIFSIPIDSEGNDIQKAGSIWITDSEGYLYRMN